ncbi:MAG: hypothetical protein UU40_C0007G0010 [Candidatus Uhrbacteria bacterium GW2011_GWD2_41_121]|uniref:Uncharacterized protein n=1 Tax=Candidatus Uhrbacteria bacterium GW2011_GWC1_41_20 TaxID=1618983 RepID=A0A0G0XQR0_9BACT|nr:MAG: hypothetical protein UT52_C0010G0010 [Candidatus Uhrbacteria bacterium GW2011_GWE1_39_46]KKR63933.1 MAG: hypothetical protein UU04_C0009G0042 [Candidatus Uhrbacteria bacterium GW2011_GWC2_40_450]KKR90155.1 MAG: hypothetical protein UU40_C0007G0010 [Candidatus Uhrbacteria bacterium GW2011_GWD2_41_121]KKR99225.1 MAG: hypothetical protein UU50_C0009G0042 [Candidatus Uhrbacteria bacterium GW2011_GWC1_41_20]KKS05961.1 MAG: hypothetical protein UU60_C0008G0010 [Candidatus Uhrbacteria bacteriu
MPRRDEWSKHIRERISLIAKVLETPHEYKDPSPSLVLRDTTLCKRGPGFSDSLEVILPDRIPQFDATNADNSIRRGPNHLE